MSDKKEQWKKWMKDLRSKGYSANDIKKELRNQGYSEKEINQVINLESTDQRKIIYSAILITIITIAFLFLLNSIPKPITPETIQTSQSIFTQISFSGITTDTVSQEEKAQLLSELENSFNQQCADINSAPSNTCFPFVIYSYIETKKQLGISQEEAHIDLSLKALNLWKKYYEEAEFDEEGFVIGETPVSLTSLNQFYHFIALQPQTEKKTWLEKISDISPTNINVRFHLLKIYWEVFNASTLSQIPEGTITQEEIENLCYNNLFIGEDRGVCGFLYYFQIKGFCGIETTDQEKSMAQQKLETQTQNQVAQVCKNGLQEMIS